MLIFIKIMQFTSFSVRLASPIKEIFFPFFSKGTLFKLPEIVMPAAGNLL
jgi:hypothetical protein